jgi:hypothetical protein
MDAQNNKLGSAARKLPPVHVTISQVDNGYTVTVQDNGPSRGSTFVALTPDMAIAFARRALGYPATSGLAQAVPTADERFARLGEQQTQGSSNDAYGHADGSRACRWQPRLPPCGRAANRAAGGPRRRRYA